MKVIVAILAGLMVVGLILVVEGVSSYNGLATSSQAVDQQWAQVENVYQRRADLVPNLVATVAGAAHFEQSTLIAVTEARASVGKVTVNQSAAPSDPATLQQFEQAQSGLSSALSRLMVVVEKYPDLKSNQNFLDLQAQLEGSENRIAVERDKFNKTVLNYNSQVVSFPSMIMAHLGGFASKPYFSAAPTASTPPAVQFNFDNTTTAPAH